MSDEKGLFGKFLVYKAVRKPCGFEWARSLSTVSVPIFAKPPGFRRQIVRYETEQAENFIDAVVRLARRLWADAGDFNLETLAARRTHDSSGNALPARTPSSGEALPGS